MNNDEKVLRYVFLSIGIALLLLAAAIYLWQYRFINSASHTQGVIVDTAWHRSHSHRASGNGTWYPVVAFRPDPNYTLLFESNIGSDFFKNSEGDAVTVFWPPGKPHEAEISNPWIRFFRWGFFAVTGAIFTGVGMLITSTGKRKRKRKKAR